MSAGLVLAIAMALAFAFTNGVHDAANAIATLVATRAARPGSAVVLAAVGNVLGPLLLGTAVANTIAGIVTVPANQVIAVLGAALTGAVVWNAVTWWRGLPSSSGHTLLGGLVGSALAEGGTGAVNWGGFDGIHPVGVLGVTAVLTIAPVLGFVAGLVVDRGARRAARRATRRLRGPVRAGQWIMSEGLALTHGANDAQKAVGVVALLLVAGGELHHLDVPNLGRAGMRGRADRGDRDRGLADREDARSAYHTDPPHRRARQPGWLHRRASRGVRRSARR